MPFNVVISETIAPLFSTLTTVGISGSDLGSFLQTRVSLVKTVDGILLALTLSLILGLINAGAWSYRNRRNPGLFASLCLLPVIVQFVILLVNGDLGTGIATMGAFSLIRFRSLPGKSRDILAIFLSMAIGLATGTGYLSLAILLTLTVVVAEILILHFTDRPRPSERVLKITLPDDFGSIGLFDDLFSQYLLRCERSKIRTSQLGSLYTLEYRIVLKANCDEKQFIDDLRVRNGNLEISLSLPESESEDL